jgi:hypothetical protein
VVHVSCTAADPRGADGRSRKLLFGFLLNEPPLVAFSWLAASTLLGAVQRDLASPIGLTAFGLAILTTGGLAVIVLRARQTRPAVDQALAAGLGTGWRSAIDTGMVGRLRRRRSWLRGVQGARRVTADLGAGSIHLLGP